MCFNFQTSFLIPPEAIPGRVAMLLTLFLCMINTLNSVAKESPKAGGVASSLVIWIAACLVFILVAIFEYICILFKARLYAGPGKVDTEGGPSLTDKPKRGVSKWTDKQMDKFMITIMPPFFFAFSLIFWGR